MGVYTSVTEAWALNKRETSCSYSLSLACAPSDPLLFIGKNTCHKKNDKKKKKEWEYSVGWTEDLEGMHKLSSNIFKLLGLIEWMYRGINE